MIDYHVHTDNSLDCKIPMFEMCRRAVAMGVIEIAFTDHFNNHMLDMDVGMYRADRYFADVDACRRAFPGLRILAGVEVGEPHRFWDRVAPVLARFPYDVVLGSLHWIGNDSMFSVNYFRARPPEKAYGDYFREMAQMVRHGGFDILAHVDLPKRLGYEVYGDFDTRAYEDIDLPGVGGVHRPEYHPLRSTPRARACPSGRCIPRWTRCAGTRRWAGRA